MISNGSSAPQRRGSLRQRKYQPLADYLAPLEVDEVTLTFADIERIIGAPLPASAYMRRFWANIAHRTKHPSYDWNAVGWRTVAGPPGRVVFRRSAPPGGPPSR